MLNLPFSFWQVTCLFAWDLLVLGGSNCEHICSAVHTSSSPSKNPSVLPSESITTSCQHPESCSQVAAAILLVVGLIHLPFSLLQDPPDSTLPVHHHHWGHFQGFQESLRSKTWIWENEWLQPSGLCCLLMLSQKPENECGGIRNDFHHPTCVIFWLCPTYQRMSVPNDCFIPKIGALHFIPLTGTSTSHLYMKYEYWLLAWCCMQAFCSVRAVKLSLFLQWTTSTMISLEATISQIYVDQSMHLLSCDGMRDPLAMQRNDFWGPTWLLPSRLLQIYLGFSIPVSLTQYFTTTIDQNSTHNFYCDSESFLNRFQRALFIWSWVNSSQCLSLDFDLESGILAIIATLGISFKYLHVKSQQNNKRTDIHLLPWTAQMSVHAGVLATDFLDNYAEPSRIVLLIAVSQASLAINGETITTQHFAQWTTASS